MPEHDQIVTNLPRDDLDKVIAHLEEDIIFGRLAPGARLTEDMLMARYGASRHFVRQALVEMERPSMSILAAKQMLWESRMEVWWPPMWLPTLRQRFAASC